MEEMAHKLKLRRKRKVLHSLLSGTKIKTSNLRASILVITRLWTLHITTLLETYTSSLLKSKAELKYIWLQAWMLKTTQSLSSKIIKQWRLVSFTQSTKRLTLSFMQFLDMTTTTLLFLLNITPMEWHTPGTNSFTTNSSSKTQITTNWSSWRISREALSSV